MSSLQVDYLVQKEKYQDLIRAAEQDRLLQVVKQQNTSHGGLHRNLAAWIGLQLVKWGSKLQQYGSVSTTQTNIYPIKSSR
ncbi:MAG: hypothetical protein DPW09_18005 [Anaerolineae bacterium]|nr:hypothetical protein [Anaerolineales bacterium]MCQ3975341.1 hypothetical protein [Anaerolineae bacterium]